MCEFACLVPSEYGLVIVNQNDSNQFASLQEAGRSLDHEDIVFLSDLVPQLPPNPVIMDVGANYGLYTLALGKAAEKVGGKVISIEGQRILSYMVKGSVALNSLTNVYCYNVVLGAERGRLNIPQYNYRQAGSFGSVEFDKTSSDVGQQRLPDTPDEQVEVVTLDNFNLDRLDLLKMDIEGMEIAALGGGIPTLGRCKPLIWVEWLKSNRAHLLEVLKALNYNVYEHGWDFFCIPAEQYGELQNSLNWHCLLKQ